MSAEPLPIGRLEPATLRFAPSPTGHLHLGHALSALINLDMARRLGGRLLIRIEDTDVTRCRPEFTEGILADLAWLGVRSDGRPPRDADRPPGPDPDAAGALGPDVTGEAFTVDECLA